MNTSLYALSTNYQQAFLGLANSEFDEETINDTLDGLEGEVSAKAQNVAAYSLNKRAEAKALKDGPLASILLRIKRAETEAEAMEKYLKINMAACGITEIKANDGTFTAKLFIGRDESVVIDDVANIPLDYLREVPATYAPDKALIKKALKDGFTVDGAHIVKNDRLEIK